MTAVRPVATAATLLATVVLAAGCGSTAPAAPPALNGATPAAPSLATSAATATGTWAVTVMGGYASQHNNFWQLFVRPAGSTSWKLVTPPGTADNGGLVVAGAGSSLITGFRPSQYLTFSPLSATSDNGRAWASDNPLDAALARVPDALAESPASHDLLALTSRGAVLQAAPGYTTWTTLTTARTLARTPAGRHCDLQNLTAAAYTASNVPVLAGTCTRPGVAGIFARSGSTWQATGPALPATLARQPVSVLRLTRTATSIAALLSAGTGPGASLVAAWSADNGSTWTVSAPFAPGGAKLTSSSFGPGGEAAIVLDGHQGETASPGPGASWQQLPALPRGTATLAPGTQGNLDALTVDRTVLTIWQLGQGSATWHATQAINVPIQFGTSG